MLCYSIMIVCAVASYWYGKTGLATTSRVFCWITGILSLPSILIGGLGLIVLAACYASYRVSERTRYKYRIPQDSYPPDFDHILDAGLN